MSIEVTEHEHSPPAAAMRYLRFDANAEDKALIDSLHATTPGLVDYECKTAAKVTRLITQPASLTVLSSHGSWHGEYHDQWGFRRDPEKKRSTAESIVGGGLIRSRVLVIAACWSKAEFWSPVLSPGSIAFVATRNVTYGAVRHSLRAFLPYVESDAFEHATDDDIVLAWEVARGKAANVARTLAARNGPPLHFAVARHRG
ncbi:hypothetical protein HD599_002502 [Conyzicola lurida]|uniref:CHAT domain-containing protein n=1 Tax=Conyzicola lurida TaxID=1172621 RepID=A0A841ARX7_9MICO|nr:hypothetical protein [Conyzicola lurida]MBB5844179.1 hypothetical protein [Conyzicola lurida]